MVKINSTSGLADIIIKDFYQKYVTISPGTLTMIATCAAFNLAELLFCIVTTKFEADWFWLKSGGYLSYISREWPALK